MTTQQTAIVFGGKTGLLGQSLVRALHEAGWDVHAPGREEVDILSFDALTAYITAVQPQVVFNTVAYTAVDAAEDALSDARQLNKCFPASLARVLTEQGAKLVHISTDFVFDGKSDTPYSEETTPNPQSVYGETKLQGEQELQKIMPEEKLIIARTAWLFGPGRRNFVETILGLCKDKDHLNVVHDQIGSPTFTEDLAAMCLNLTEKDAHGIFHLVNSGQASWCELAAEAVAFAGAECQILPIPSSEYPQKARRPAFSVLSTARYTEVTGKTPRPWIQALRDYILEHLMEQ